MEVIVATILAVLVFDSILITFGLAAFWLSNQLWQRRLTLLSTDIPEKKKTSAQFYTSDHKIKLARYIALYTSFLSAFFGGILIAVAIALTIGFPIMVGLFR